LKRQEQKTQKNRRRPRVSLEDILAYSNPMVVNRYLEEFGGSRKEAELVFREMLKWLFLHHFAVCVSRKKYPACLMTWDIARIDDMWHSFILFTRDYFRFCNHYFGEYLHHGPTTKEEPKITLRLERQQFLNFAEFVYDILGEETFRDWFFSGRFKKPVRKNKLRIALPK
jgi:hypothetical protein